MSVTATCGHVLTEEEGLGTTIYKKDFARTGHPAVSYVTLCNACLKQHREANLELKTEAERQDWLKATGRLSHYPFNPMGGGFSTLRLSNVPRILVIKIQNPNREPEMVKLFDPDYFQGKAQYRPLTSQYQPVTITVPQSSYKDIQEQVINRRVTHHIHGLKTSYERPTKTGIRTDMPSSIESISLIPAELDDSNSYVFKHHHPASNRAAYQAIQHVSDDPAFDFKLKKGNFIFVIVPPLSEIHLAFTISQTITPTPKK